MEFFAAQKVMILTIAQEFLLKVERLCLFIHISTGYPQLLWEYYSNVLTPHMSCAYDGRVRNLAGFLTRESPLFTQVNNPYRPSGSSTTVRKTLIKVRVFFSPRGSKKARNNELEQFQIGY